MGNGPSRRLHEPMLAWLAECAAAGRTCPSNEEIADRYELAGAHLASGLMRQLAKAGSIRLTVTHMKRVVTIVASGAQTAVIAVSAIE